MKRKEELLIIGLSVLAAGGTLYLIHKQKNTTNASSDGAGGAVGPFNLAEWDPTAGGLTNIGGSLAKAGVPNGSQWIGNPMPNQSNTSGAPIGIDPTTGQITNLITGQVVSPSSWQGTTNASGSLTYLPNQLAGEGSSIGALQGVTY